MIDIMSSSPRRLEGRHNDTVRVLIVEDQVVSRSASQPCSTKTMTSTWWTRASDIASAVAAATRHRPDVVLMDFRLPDRTGVEAIGQLRAAGCDAAVIMLTTATDRRVLRLALEAGCLGFLSKNADHGDLVRAIRAAARNETSFTADMLTHVVHVGRVSRRR